MSINLDDTQKIQVQTHIDLIQKSYAKVQAQQYAASELEKDFQGFINVIITDGGGDPEKQYSYNLETGTLDEVDPATANNGTGNPDDLHGTGPGQHTHVETPSEPKVGDSFDV